MMQRPKAAGKSVLVIDRREHIAGNIYTENIDFLLICDIIKLISNSCMGYRI